MSKWIKILEDMGKDTYKMWVPKLSEYSISWESGPKGEKLCQKLRNCAKSWESVLKLVFMGQNGGRVKGSPSTACCY